MNSLGFLDAGGGRGEVCVGSSIEAAPLRPTRRPNVSVLLAAAGGGAIAWSRLHAAAARAQKGLYRIEGGATKDQADPQIMIVPSLPGVLSVRATAKVEPFGLQHRAIWWRLELRQWNGVKSLYESFLTRAYRKSAFQLQAGQPALAEFADDLSVPSGRYELVHGTR